MNRAERKQLVKVLITAMLTDFYQISMAYAYWLANMHEKYAVFDLFFRKCPFGGEYAVYSGLENSLYFLENFKFSKKHIEFIRRQMPHADPRFFEWLATVDCRDIRIYAVAEGDMVFPRVPIMRVEGPLAIAQLLETALLNINNFGTLSATNAARHREAAGWEKVLLEFGLRRAQGPDGALTASRSSYIGGFDGTSNVYAGYLFDIPVKGTHAHAYVQSFTSIDQARNSKAAPQWPGFIDEVLEIREKLGYTQTHAGELAAFIAYAIAYPDGFLALVDTYDTLRSGVPNFMCVALALAGRGHKPLGIRLDSGDLAFLSREARRMFDEHDALRGAKIAASNDITEDVLWELQKEEHAIDIFGIGTYLVTCKGDPALGGVFKLVLLDGDPRIKLSEEDVKITIPGEKDAYRLVGENGIFLLDVMVDPGEEPPRVGTPFFCRHPFNMKKKSRVTPSDVIKLLNLKFDGKVVGEIPEASEARENCRKQIVQLRPDMRRILNPTPYKVSVSASLYEELQALRENEAPVGELK